MRQLQRHALGMIAAAAMLGAQPAFPSNAPRMPRAHVAREQALSPRAKRLQERKAAGLTRQRLLNQFYNDRKRREARARNAEFQAIVNTMTNWERNRWARAGYPGLREKDVQAVYPYAGRAA